MKFIWISLASIWLLAGCTSMRPTVRPLVRATAGAQTEQLFTATISHDATFRYLLYLPKDYGVDPVKQFPLVLFLHEAGERGTNVQKVAVHGPPKLIAAGREFPFICVSPQCPETRMSNSRSTPTRGMIRGPRRISIRRSTIGC